MKNKIYTKVNSLYNNFILHWKNPAFGKYVSNKEVLSYGVGGMGVQFVIVFSSLIALSATSFLVGNTIGIKPLHLQFMAVISTFLGFGITIVRSYLIDSSKFKSGKFRPWLATMGIPTVIISIVFVWLPYETMAYSQKVAAVFICFNLLQCFFPFFQNSYTDLANVISPNSHERTDIISVASIIYSMAPSITGAFVPMLSTLTGGLNNITTYRIIHPIIAVIGLCLAYFAVVGTKERIIQAKTHIVHFKFTDAFRAVAKNKYFWITSLAGWLGFLETAVAVITGWTFIYGYPDRMGTYGIAVTLIGNASLWAMLISPIAIRKIGKRNLLIWCNIANVFLIGALYPLYNNLIALIVLFYLNGFVNAFAIVYNPGINADMRDYQQYYTGERIDGMFGAVGIIGSFVGMFTGMILPFLYTRLGLADNYDVLEVASFREDMFETLIIAAVIGAALNCVPYFFYDLTEVKQKSIVKVLKIRALFEDYGNGVLKDEDLVEAIDIIDEANSLYVERLNMTTKQDITNAKRLPKETPQKREFRKNEIKRVKGKFKSFEKEKKEYIKEKISKAQGKPYITPNEKAERKAAIKAARQENAAYKKLNDDISVCDFVINEMNKFNTLRIQKQVERANKVIIEGASGLLNAQKSIKKEARALPRKTHEQREIRSDALVHARSILSCKKNLKKYYKDGLIIPDQSSMEKAEALPEETLFQRIHKKRKLKALVNENSHYTRSVKVLLDAKRLITEKENYTHLDEIREKYEEAKFRLDDYNTKKRQEIEKLEKQRKLDLEKRKQERINAKNNKNSKKR